MLNWSLAGYKFTLGLGSLAIVGMLSDLWKAQLPVEMAVGIAVLPLLVFIVVRPRELPTPVVWMAHVAAALWYAIAATGLLLATALNKPMNVPDPRLMYLAFAAAGAIPCGTVLYRVARGRYCLAEDALPSNTEAESNHPADGQD